VHAPRRRRYFTWKRLKYARFLTSLTNGICYSMARASARKNARAQRWRRQDALRHTHTLFPLNTVIRIAPRHTHADNAMHAHAVILAIALAAAAVVSASTSCTAPLVYMECGSACTPTCADPSPMCTMQVRVRFERRSPQSRTRRPFFFCCRYDASVILCCSFVPALRS
jgi:hypothetical protein